MNRSNTYTKIVCLIGLLSIGIYVSAANVTLVPTTPVVNVQNGDIVSFDVVIDFSDIGGPLGGSFDLDYDPDALQLDGLFFDQTVGDPDFNRIPNISQITGLFKSWAVGHFDILPDIVVLGNHSFEIKPSMGVNTIITTSPTSGVGGPWISGSDTLLVINPSYNQLVITRTNGVGSVCGDSLLYTGESCDDANANDGDGCSAICIVEAGYECTLPMPGNPPSPSVCTGLLDTDGDLVIDTQDNCLLIANLSQIDVDNDGFGNACDPDFNNDCAVNFGDYSRITDVFLSTVSPLYDLNSDGVVNFADFGLFADYFLQPPGPSGIAHGCQ